MLDKTNAKELRRSSESRLPVMEKLIIESVTAKDEQRYRPSNASSEQKSEPRNRG